MFDIHIPSETERDLTREAALAGELSPESQLHVPSHFLALRAIFLRNWQIYHLFADIDTMNLDFWRAIESDIPEIQARVLTLFSYASGKEALPKIGSLNDASTIRWTPNLKQNIRKLIDFYIRFDHWIPTEVYKVLGAVDMDYPDGFPGRPRQSLREYLVERIRSKLQYKTEFEKREDLEKEVDGARIFPDFTTILVEAGYLYYPALEVDSGILEPLIKGSIMVASFDMLKYIVELFDTSRIPPVRVVLRYSKPVTFPVVKRMRAILENPEMVRLMADSVVEKYKILAGYEEPEDAPVRLESFEMLVGNPGNVTVGQSSLIENVSIQSCVMYDPVWTTDFSPQISNWIGTLAYAMVFSRGQGHLLDRPPEPSNLRATVVALNSGRSLNRVPDFTSYEDLRDLESRGIDVSVRTERRDEMEKKYQRILQELRA